MIDLAQIAEICAKHGLQEKADDYGTYWVYPEFEDALIIAIDENRNWHDKIPGQQGQGGKELGMAFDNASLADLDRYLITLFDILHRRETASQ